MKKQLLAIVCMLVASDITVYAQSEKWDTVSIPGICTYQIPPTIELQKGIYKRFNDPRHPLVIATLKSHKQKDLFDWL